MEKESIIRFISLFDTICQASILLKGTTNDRLTESCIKNIEVCYKNFENGDLVNDASKEIENNLYGFPTPEQRIAYIKDLLRLFVLIAPYFNHKTETDLSINFKVGVAIVPGAKYTMQVVNNYCNGKYGDNFGNQSIEIRYVIECFIALHYFTPLLDAKCLSFDIDLQEIQNEVQIYIQHNRQWDTLGHYGYKQKEFNKRELQTEKTIISKPNNNQVSKPDIEIDATIILLEIKFDRDEVKKKAIGNILSELDERGLLTTFNGNEFTALASILYKTGWVNTATFAKWLKLLSKACNREKTPSSKEGQVKILAKEIKEKYTFLDKLPIK